MTSGGNQVGSFGLSDIYIKDLASDSTYIWAINTSGIIKQFTVDGTLVDSIVGLLSSGWGLTYGDGYLWVSDPIENMIYQITLGDVSSPTMEVIVELQGQYYNSAPSFSNFGFDDNVDLDNGWYQIDSYIGPWTPLFTDAQGASWNDDGWVLPEFAALADGSHKIYFKASDDFGNIEGELGEWSWQFYKDVTPPSPFELIHPANYTWVNVTRPMFIWHSTVDQLSGLSEYRIYVDETPRDSSIDTLWMPNFDLYEGYHEWQVLAFDGAGNYRESHEVLTCGIDTTAPTFSETIVWSDTSFQGPYLVTANVLETRSGVDSVLLYYRFDEGLWQRTPMHVLCDINYGAEIPQVPDSNTSIHYYLKAKDLATNETLDPKNAPDNTYSFVGWVGIAESYAESPIPTTFALLQNYPNPFGHSTVISYEIPRSTELQYLSSVSLKVYDLTGRLVRTLVDEYQQLGYYEVKWNGLDDNGTGVLKGVYMYRMVVSSATEKYCWTQAKKMILLEH